VNMTWRADTGAMGQFLPDGRRAHFQHGPIDLIVDADGPEDARAAAFERAWTAFADALPSLVAKLPVLRQPVGPSLDGPIARRMRDACLPHGLTFVTPMAAVAGAVADHVLDAMVSAQGLARAYVNNGGDIALWVGNGAPFRTGMVFDYGDPALDGLVEIGADDGIGGIATSGWQGRSFSLGIADSVTVLARNAAAADVAATLIANAVDANHPNVVRAPADTLDPDSDLGGRLVTTDVGPLDQATIASALDAGLRTAQRMRRSGLIVAARLTLKDETRIETGPAGLAAAA
jgi:ApbE superfamily uncharacterized protein (UPF0280 family)